MLNNSNLMLDYFYLKKHVKSIRCYWVKKMNIGNKIVELRKKNNLTQEKLSEKIKVSRQTLASWEGNITSPNLEQAAILSKEFKISLDELVDNELDIICKDNTNNSILNNLVNKTCYLEFDDYYLDVNTPVKVIDVSSDFIEIEYKKGKDIYHKLIDIDLIVSIKEMEED